MSRNIRCITYQNAFSAENSAYRDLIIGSEHNVVGYNSKIFGSSKPGDLVIINAVRDRIKYAIIGMLQTKLDSCNAWINEGGRNWLYNFTYIPLTSIFQYDTETKEEIMQFCEQRSLKWKNIFHSRFCSNKLEAAVDLLIEKFVDLN